MPLINSVFLPTDAEVILAIPFVPHGQGINSLGIVLVLVS